MAIQVSKRIIRFVLLASLVFLSVVYVIGQMRTEDYYRGPPKEPVVGGEKQQKATPQSSDAPSDAGKNGQNAGSPLNAPNRRTNATFVSLVRNEDLDDMVEAVRMVEDRFNHKFNYPWVFLNDKPFNENFKKVISNVVTGDVEFGLIPEEHWSVPDWIDRDKFKQGMEKLVKENVIYGGVESYRHMCRFESGFFWRHELMNKYSWYWRVEPNTKLFCDIDYDVFKWMEDNQKVYGFTISMREYQKTVPTLWETTMEFTKNNPQYVAKNNLMDFVSDNKGQTFNLCHFWSNFEIASLDFWRSEAYQKYFEFLDKKGGFFYERWGDAPVHSIAASLFLPKEKIHHFADIGYYHPPYTQCPSSDELWKRGRCSCKQENDFTFEDYSCGKQYHKVMNLKIPAHKN